MKVTAQGVSRWIATMAMAVTFGATAGSIEDQVREGLAPLADRVPIESVTALEDTGLFVVQLASGELIYATADGRHFVSGDLYQVSQGELVNLTERAQWGQRAELIAAIDDQETVIFSPAGETRARVSVFTDIDCGYCRKLHDEIEQYTDLGIEIQYLAFPRAGLESQSYQKYVSAYCAADPHAALTAAKAGQTIPSASCANPIADQYNLGNQMGVRGTPSMILSSGQMIPGYVPRTSWLSSWVSN